VTLEAEADLAATADEEEERAAQSRLADSDMFDIIEEEAAKHQEGSKLDQDQAAMQIEEVEDSPTMEESQETKEKIELDLLDVDIINKNTSHSKATKATFAKRVYKCV
jgi:hypothetical protein